MTTHTLTARPQRTLRRFDTAVETVLGADMRLIYGFGVPIVAMSLLIGVLMLWSSPVAVAIALAAELVTLGVVMLGFLAVFDEPADEAAAASNGDIARS